MYPSYTTSASMPMMWSIIACLVLSVGLFYILRWRRGMGISYTDVHLLEAWALKAELAAMQLTTSKDHELVFSFEGRIEKYKVATGNVPEVASILLLCYQDRMSPRAERVAMQSLAFISADKNKSLYSTVLDLLKKQA